MATTSSTDLQVCDRSALLVAAIVLAAASACGGTSRPPSALRVADLHVDAVYWRHYRGRSLTLKNTGSESQVSARGLRRGGVQLLVLSLYLDSGLRPATHTYGDFDALLTTADAMVAANSDLFGGPHAIKYLFSVEGCHALVGHEHKLPLLVQRGVAIFGLTHSLHNALADSSTDPRKGRGGLTARGIQFAHEVYRAGGLIDVSHASDEAFADIAAVALTHKAPLLATHSNTRALTAHRRNLTDDQLRAVAASGGLVGIAFHSRLLWTGRGPASTADVVRHIRHAIEIAGPRHVAIGSDLDGKIKPARGLSTHAGLAELAHALIESGISRETLGLVLSGNAQRVLAPLLAQRTSMPYLQL
ncbi:MAG: membrane dipeptidase [Kofleriaceae bacterium]|nr:membrane dipeptidase [Kofleriaceae bacterium]